MSRWSEEFDGHHIHQALVQATTHLETQVEGVDADFEIERRRLGKVLDNLEEIILGLDKEFYPKATLDTVDAQINQHVLPQLAAFASNPSITQLKTANDHLSRLAPEIHQLAAMSRPAEAQDVISKVEDKFSAVVRAMDEAESEMVQKIGDQDGAIQTASESLQALGQKLENLETTSNSKLAQWETEFTDAETARAKAHSDAQIERDQKFEELLLDWKSGVDEQHSTISKEQTEKLETAFTSYKDQAEKVLEDVKAKHQSIREIHKLVGRDSVAGGYQTSAGEEKTEADRWRLISLACLALAIIWLVIKYALGFSTTADGNLNWPDIITASSLTAIFLVAAGYTSRQSKLHRDNEKQLRSYALETQALDPFIASLPPKTQEAIKAELVRRMFGQQNQQLQGKQVKLDDESVNALLERLSDGLSNVVEKVKDKG